MASYVPGWIVTGLSMAIRDGRLGDPGLGFSTEQLRTSEYPAPLFRAMNHL